MSKRMCENAGIGGGDADEVQAKRSLMPQTKPPDSGVPGLQQRSGRPITAAGFGKMAEGMQRRGQRDVKDRGLLDASSLV